MSELSKDDVIEVLGPRLGDIAIAEIIATGITKDELVSAKARVVSDHKAHEPGPSAGAGTYQSGGRYSRTAAQQRPAGRGRLHPDITLDVSGIFVC